MSTTVADVKEYQWYAGGQWRDVANGQLLDDFEPDRGNLYARVADLRCRRSATCDSRGAMRRSVRGRRRRRWRRLDCEE